MHRDKVAEELQLLRETLTPPEGTRVPRELLHPRPSFAWLVPIALAAAGALAGVAVNYFKANEAYQQAKADHDDVVKVLEILPRIERHLEKTDNAIEVFNRHVAQSQGVAK